MGFKRFQERLLSVGLCLAVGLIYGCSQEGLIFFPDKLRPDHKFDYRDAFEEIMLPVEGATIHALLFRTDKPKGVVLYFHGNAGSLLSWGDVAPDFTRRGFDVFIPDYRGFGKSTGKITSEAQFLADGVAVYDYLSRLYPESQTLIYGRSIGTGVAVHTAAMRAPRMVILESPFFNLIDLAAYHYPLIPVSLIRSFLRYPLRTDLWIEKVRCPIYLLHGTADFTIPYRESERLIRLCGERCRLIRLEEGGHNNLADFAAYHEQLDIILRGKGE